MGLARANEAAGEAAHHVWMETYKHYKCNDETSQAFKDSGLMAIARVNSNNMFKEFPKLYQTFLFLKLNLKILANCGRQKKHIYIGRFGNF